MADALLKLHVIPRGSRNEIIGKRGDSLAPVETKEREECGSVRMLAGFPLGALLGALLFLRFLGLFLGFSFATLFF